MPNVEKSKQKLLILLNILMKYTDESHPLTAEELCEQLMKKGVPTERKSIYRSISALMDCGFEIISTRALPKPGYFLANRDFELAEVRLLMDAVLAAPFITSKKTQELTGKLRSLLSCYQADEVLKQVYVERRVKFDNEEIYYIIDALNTAISSKKKIRFCYHHRIISGDQLQFDDGREFVISPYALIWSNDKYYLAGNYDKYNTVGNYRIDRMKHITITDEDARPFNEVSNYVEYFDVSDYLKKSFNMYNGEQEQIELCCANSILETIVDKFGSNLSFARSDDEHFCVQANVCISDGLIEWLMQYGDRVVVNKPDTLRERLIDKIKELSTAYHI
ncbi:MAG TPA: WYL domain-containing transcriptional regulator [Oscillospiraceae bacterium]|nr:WYL domain-containing transcriptional regulator [Oscillospiraceae bacterium]